MSNNGKFVWFDLMTTDVEAAKAFYTETIGWKTQAWDGAMPYTMFAVGQQPIGGAMALPEEAKKMGAPPHWMAYTQVENVDATVTKVGTLGGKTLKEAFDIPKVGRVAFLADPQGAAFAIFTPEQEMPLPDGTKDGVIAWHELNTTDWEGAWTFYSQVFGWEKGETMDMGPNGQYQLFGYNKTDNHGGGMCNSAKAQGFPPAWLYYVNVDDVPAACERIKQKGGKIVLEPMEIPGGGKISVFSDPQGAQFAVHSAPKDAS